MALTYVDMNIDQMANGHMGWLCGKVVFYYFTIDWNWCGELRVPCLFVQLQVEGSVDVEVGYYNEKLSVWEPLIEPVTEENSVRRWQIRFEVAVSDFPFGIFCMISLFYLVFAGGLAC